MSDKYCTLFQGIYCILGEAGMMDNAVATYVLLGYMYIHVVEYPHRLIIYMEHIEFRIFIYQYS